MTLPPLREVVARHGIGARKALGQNFLFDLNLTGRIARAGAPLDECAVIEVGPGPGGLTRALLEAGASRVIAIEKDRRCLDALAEIAAAFPGRLDVVEGDALAIDEATLTGGAPFKVVANLPYNIATPLLIKWLKRVHGQPGLVRGLVLMFQREVAERIVAKPGGKTYGRLSVLAQWLTEARLLFDVAPSAFVPPPKVVSSVIRLAPRPGPLSPADLSDLEKVVAAAFGQRRKMLRSALRGLGDAEALCREAGIEPTERAERISVEGFCALARAYGGLSHLR